MLDPRRAETEFQADLAKVRRTRRTRLGMVAGVAVVALFQARYDRFETIALILGLILACVLAVVSVARLDMKRAERRYDSQRFRVPVRKSKK